MEPHPYSTLKLIYSSNDSASLIATDEGFIPSIPVDDDSIKFIESLLFSPHPCCSSGSRYGSLYDPNINNQLVV